MKRTARFLTVLLLILLLLPAAHADVLWTPDNNFFYTHEKDCTYVGRSYYANGPEGYVTLWNSPNSKSYNAQYENGTALHVYWLYEDWGCITVWNGRESVDGWVPMTDLVLIYDNTSFQEEYGDRIVPYTDEFDAFGPEVECINLYAYPGAPEIHHTILLKGDTTSSEEKRRLFPSKDGPVSSVFVDENGHTWGYISYWQGNRSTWFCLDEPDGEDFPVREVTRVELIPAPAQPEPSPSPVINAANSVVQSGDTQPLTPPAEPVPPKTAFLAPWLLVGGVALITAALLFLLARLRKKGAKN